MRNAIALVFAFALGACATSDDLAPDRRDEASFDKSDGVAPAEAESCESTRECDAQDLDEPECPGSWRCEHAACVYRCFAPASLQPWDPSVGEAACAQAYTRGLHRCDATPDDYIVISKAAHNAALCHLGALVENQRIGLGADGDKEREGDERTPEGVFYVARRISASAYDKALLLSYPSPEDAARGLAAGLIDRSARDAIVTAEMRCAEPPQSTELGGLIEVHGGGAGIDWTWGCAAMRDTAIDRFYSALSIRDTIVVLP